MYDDRVPYRISAQGLALERRRENAKRANVERFKNERGNAKRGKTETKERRDGTERERNGGRETL